MLLLVVFPQLLIFVGRILLASDIPSAITDEIPKLPPILGQAVLTAWLLAGLALALAAFTPRRAYATAAIFAAVLVPLVAVGAIGELSGADLAGAVSLISPADILEGANAFVYGHAHAGPAGADVSSWLYVLAAIVMAVVATLVLVLRYRRIEP